MNHEQEIDARERLTRPWLEAEPSVQAFVLAAVSRAQDAEDFVQQAVLTEAEWDLTSHGLRLSAELDLLMSQSTGPAPRDTFDLRIGPARRSIVPPETRLTKSK